MTSKLLGCLSVAVLPFMIGCYDAGDEDECVGFNCPIYGFDKPEGGHIALEVILLPDGNAIRRAFTFAVSGQEPEFVPMPKAGDCVDFMEQDAWPVAQADNREYIDFGGKVTMTSTTGDLSLELPRAEGDAAFDFWERTHDLAYKWIVFEGTAEDEMFNTMWSVELEDDPLGINDELQDRIFMPRRFTPTEPELPTLVEFKQGEDFTFNWEHEDVTPKYDGMMASFVLFLDANFATHAMCMQRDAGHLTIPGEFMEKLPEGGVLQLGVLYDDPILTDAGRLIHVTGLSCVASGYQVTAE